MQICSRYWRWSSKNVKYILSQFEHTVWFTKVIANYEGNIVTISTRNVCIVIYCLFYSAESFVVYFYSVRLLSRVYLKHFIRNASDMLGFLLLTIQSFARCFHGSLLGYKETGQMGRELVGYRIRRRKSGKTRAGSFVQMWLSGS